MSVKKTYNEALKWYQGLSDEDQDLADKTIVDLQNEHLVTEEGALIMLFALGLPVDKEKKAFFDAMSSACLMEQTIKRGDQND